MSISKFGPRPVWYSTFFCHQAWNCVMTKAKPGWILLVFRSFFEVWYSLNTSVDNWSYSSYKYSIVLFFPTDVDTLIISFTFKLYDTSLQCCFYLRRVMHMNITILIEACIVPAWLFSIQLKSVCVPMSIAARLLASIYSVWIPMSIANFSYTHVCKYKVFWQLKLKNVAKFACT